MRQRKQTQINKYNIRENHKIVEYDYKVVYKVITYNNYAYKYETSYNRPLVLTRCFTNDMVTLQCGAIKLGIIYVALSHIYMIQSLNILNVEN